MNGAGGLDRLLTNRTRAILPIRRTTPPTMLVHAVWSPNGHSQRYRNRHGLHLLEKSKGGRAERCVGHDRGQVGADVKRDTSVQVPGSETRTFAAEDCMGWIGIIAIVIFSGVLLLALGLLAGFHVGQRWTGSDPGDHFRENIELWKSVVARVDELTRRNAVELGAIRERLAGIERAISDSRVTEAIDELIASSRRLEQGTHSSRPRRATRRVPDSQARTKRSHEIDPELISKSAGAGQAQQPHAPSGDPLIQIRSAVEEKRPLFEVLDLIYDELRTFLPFQRMGFAEVNEEADRVVAAWYRSESPVHLKAGYSASLSKSSLQFVARQNRPRVLNNLPEYLSRHANSHSTRLIVEEGFRSSLTCPLATDDSVLGFLFFTSAEIDAFRDEHVALARRVTDQLLPGLLVAQEQAIA